MSLFHTIIAPFFLPIALFCTSLNPPRTYIQSRPLPGLGGAEHTPRERSSIDGILLTTARWVRGNVRGGIRQAGAAAADAAATEVRRSFELSFVLRSGYFPNGADGASYSWEVSISHITHETGTVELDTVSTNIPMGDEAFFSGDWASSSGSLLGVQYFVHASSKVVDAFTKYSQGWFSSRSTVRCKAAAPKNTSEISIPKFAVRGHGDCV